MVAILLLAGRARDGLVRRGLPRGLAEATALTGAATLGTAPLIAAHFGQASLVSLPANVLAAPAVAPAMWLAMIAVALGQLGTALAAPFVALAAFPVAYVMWVAHVASGLPGARASAPAGVVGAVCAAAALAVDGSPRTAAGRGGRARRRWRSSSSCGARPTPRSRHGSLARLPADSLPWPRARRAPGSRRPPACGSPSSTSVRATRR